MKEKPILFSGSMVRALLAGTKTQTRRAMRVQPHGEALPVVERYHRTVIDKHHQEQPGPEVFGAWWSDGECGLVCPYGQPGDRLWVRESWMLGQGSSPIYRASDPIAPPDQHWRPSIHMPRTVCRLRLEITEVRVERLQGISEADAQAEGAAGHPDGPRHSFRSLWTLINGPESWDADPWVWAVSFRIASPTAPEALKD